MHRSRYNISITIDLLHPIDILIDAINRSIESNRSIVSNRSIGFNWCNISDLVKHASIDAIDLLHQSMQWIDVLNQPIA